MSTTDIQALDATAERLARITGRYASDEGRAEMRDRRYVASSVHRSAIADILHDAHEHERLDPLDIPAIRIFV